MCSPNERRSSRSAQLPRHEHSLNPHTHLSTAQVKRCADAGADIVRITVQGKKEAEACMAIREQLFKDRCGWGQRIGLNGRQGRQGMQRCNALPQRAW